MFGRFDILSALPLAWVGAAELDSEHAKSTLQVENSEHTSARVAPNTEEFPTEFPAQKKIRHLYDSLIHLQNARSTAEDAIVDVLRYFGNFIFFDDFLKKKRTILRP